ncbi:hypothetical protein FRB90_006821 [Tulasnella sp. 427]|nr:hypothetical protein FRB90_006821 [Tulasnella sp. 427]
MTSLSPASSPERSPANLPSAARVYTTLSLHESCTIQVLKATDDGFLQVVLPFARPKHAVRTEVSLTIEQITKTDISSGDNKLEMVDEESPVDDFPVVPATVGRKHASHRLARHWRSASNLRAKVSNSSISLQPFDVDGAQLMEVLRQRSTMFNTAAQAKHKSDK